MTSSDHLICLDSAGTTRNLRVAVGIDEWWDKEGAVSSNVWLPVPSVVAIAVLAMADKAVLLAELSKRNLMNRPHSTCTLVSLSECQQVNWKIGAIYLHVGILVFMGSCPYHKDLPHWRQHSQSAYAL